MTENKNNGKLSNKIFIVGMEYLEAFYVNFKIDTSNKMVQQIWKDFFKNFDDTNFIKMIKSYCVKNVYAPTSPTSLLEHYKNERVNNSIEYSLAFDKVLNEVRNARYVYSQVLNLNDLELKTLKECEVHFEKFRVDTSYQTFLLNAFKSAYEKNIKSGIEKEIEENVLKLENYINESFLLE